MKEKLLITGASGFIGGHIALELKRRGRQVRAQYRRSEVPPHLRTVADWGGETVRADLTRAADLEALVEGCTGVIHAAAAVEDFGPYERFHRINYQATVDLFRAAVAAGCTRFTFISSISVHGFGPHRYSSEEGPYYPLISNYQKTKKMAEDFVLSSPQEPMSSTAIRPGLVYGPGDTTTLRPVFRLLQSEKLPMVAGFRSLTCPIYVTDLVEAVIRAHEASVASGRVYDITSGEAVCFRDAVDHASALLGVNPPRRNVPSWAAMAVATAMESLHRVLPLSGRPLLTRYLVSQIRDDFHFAIERARSELGFEPEVDWRTGLRLAVHSFLSGDDFFVDSVGQGP